MTDRCRLERNRVNINTWNGNKQDYLYMCKELAKEVGYMCAMLNTDFVNGIRVRRSKHLEYIKNHLNRIKT